MDAFTEQYKRYQQVIDAYLSGQFMQKCNWSDLYEAMRYSLLSGGKRIRPVLTVEFARLMGLDWRLALPIACAVELTHTYSLIHDDLPCMDNDDLRRGKPTNHKVYGETLAILAGDALQVEAFRLILTAPSLEAKARADCAFILARAAGADGMIAGQTLDTLHTHQTEESLSEVHRLKTGAMIAGACMMGVAAAGGNKDALYIAEEYGLQIGLAFQIRDDILDVIGETEELGKTVGSDQKSEKVTFVTLFGVDECMRRVHACTQKAIEVVKEIDRDGFLKTLAETLVKRRN